MSSPQYSADADVSEWHPSTLYLYPAGQYVIDSKHLPAAVFVWPLHLAQSLFCSDEKGKEGEVRVCHSLERVREKVHRVI